MLIEFLLLSLVANGNGRANALLHIVLKKSANSLMCIICSVEPIDFTLVKR